MKKIIYFFVLSLVAVIFGSCAVGSYVPTTLNVGGVSTQVVLSQANFRVVRNIETVVEINNDNLRRADVEKSAFAELSRKYPLTGSQAYINVVLEEIRREKFGMGGGLQKRKQFVAVRATIIEFLQGNGQPIKSVESPYTIQSEPQKVESQDSHVSSTPTPEPTEAEIKALAKLERNIYYIMLLHKISNLDTNKMVEIQQLFDFKNIIKEAPKYTVKELQEKSAQHDKCFEKFAFRK